MNTFNNTLNPNAITNQLVRPEITHVLPGLYEGIIENAGLKEFPDKFNNQGTRTVLNLKIKVFTEQFGEITLYYSVNFKWYYKSKFVALLNELNIMPNAGEALKLEDFKDIKVLVTVENNEKDGEVYANIVSVSKADEF